jgi:hypothetical protein
MNVHDKIILVFLVLLVLINGIFAIASSYSGPVLGAVFAVFTSIHWWKERNSTFIIIIAIIWIVFHIYEWIASGPGLYPIFFYSNLMLPLLLIYFSIKFLLLLKNKSVDGKHSERH